jgi:oxygen-independent coproporphyrinogen-3 oxidase
VSAGPDAGSAMSSLYLHIPFCEHKCIYCDFYSIESLDPMKAFLRALHAEIALQAGLGVGETFGTIFFGGGTPSLLSPEELGAILLDLRTAFDVAPDAEITLEANPGTVDGAKLAAYRDLGINRLSFGVQSFHDDELKFLTRIHSADQARAAVRLARESGFEDLSVDLIFALPGQTMERWMANLRAALELDPTHISAYSLIVEAGTPLHRMVTAKLVSPLPLETEAVMYERTMELLGAAGFEHYEVSNYARPGRRSRHNSNYWNHAHYLGFGPSAHSFQHGRRWWNVANVSTYCDKLGRGTLPLAGEETLTTDELFDEAVMLGLRSDGIDLGRLRAHHGVDLLAGSALTIEQMVGERLALLEGERLRLTDKGYLLCDAISARLLSEVRVPDVRVR